MRRDKFIVLIYLSHLGYLIFQIISNNQAYWKKNLWNPWHGIRTYYTIYRYQKVMLWRSDVSMEYYVAESRKKKTLEKIAHFKNKETSIYLPMLFWLSHSKVMDRFSAENQTLERNSTAIGKRTSRLYLHSSTWLLLSSVGWKPVWN